MLVHMLASLPWPFAARDLVFEAVGVDCTDRGARGQIVVLLESATVAHPELGQHVPPPAAGVVRAELAAGAVTLTPAALAGGGGGGAGGVRVEILLRADPKMAFVPDWLVNVAVRHLCFYALELLAAQARAVHTGAAPAYAAPMAADPAGFYAFVRARLAQLGLDPDAAA
jgi:hypothetical protein